MIRPMVIGLFWVGAAFAQPPVIPVLPPLSVQNAAAFSLGLAPDSLVRITLERGNPAPVGHKSSRYLTLTVRPRHSSLSRNPVISYTFRDTLAVAIR